MTAIDEIPDQENQRSHARRMLDLDAIDRIYADDLVITGQLGEPTCSKSAVIDEMQRGIAERNAAKAEGAQFDTRVENEDTRVVPLGDTAVATHRFVVTAHMAFVLGPQQAAMLERSGPR